MNPCGFEMILFGGPYANFRFKSWSSSEKLYMYQVCVQYEDRHVCV